MAEHKKNIYLCKSIEELNKKVETPSIAATTLHNSTAKTILNSGEKLVLEARKSFDLGDEEQAYILYMRVATLYLEIKRSKGYASDPKYYESLTKQSLLEAITRSEALKNSIRGRYALLKLAGESDVVLKEKEMKDATEMMNKGKAEKKTGQHRNVNGLVKPGVKKEADEECGMDKDKQITVNQLKSLIEQKSTSILVIDCRGRHDFGSSHLSYANCISIPQELLEPGMSANKIESKLKEKQPESYHSWNKRGSFDKVILYDWNSTFDNMQSCLTTLFTAMTKWDHETSYKSRPAILQGGFKNLYYMYPHLINHPQNTSSDLNLYEEKESGSVTNGDTNASLNSISYPNLDDDDSKPMNNFNNATRTSTSSAPSSQQQPLNNLSSKLDNKYSGNNNSIPPIPVPPTGTIDRSTKPKSASFINVPNNIVPVHNQNGPSAASDLKAKVNGLVGPDSHSNSSSGNATETVAALNTALDNVIISSKELKIKEEELQDIINTEHSESDPLVQKLKMKEEEIERLQYVVKHQDASLLKAKAEYDALMATKAKPSLPQIRPSQTDSTIDSKFKEKKDLEEYVRQIRAKRKETERAPVPIPPSSTVNNRLPTIPGSGSSSPRPLSRSRVGKSESTTTFPTVNKAAATNGFADAKGTQSTSALLRPMSQDATPVSYQKLKDEPSSENESPRSLLKRSHSHPNIAQSLSEEDAFIPDDNTRVPLPQFNRNLKPSASNRPSDVIIPSRAREFHAVNSTEKHRTGLKNLGNTCYMNSIVQCLIHLPGLVEYFNGESWKSHLRLFRPQKVKQSIGGEVSLEFHAVVQEMNYGHRSIAIMDFKNNVGRHHSSFKGNEQQDSHEFMTLLLDWLHEELNTVCKMKLNAQKNDGLSDSDASDLTWADYCSSNRSKISELFCGQQKSSVRCLSCGKESVTFEVFSSLSVPIPSINRKVDIYQCIDLYTTEEALSGWHCPHCKSYVKATKKIDLWRLPPYLIIHLQRFYNDGWWKKRLTEVDFPVDNLDLTSRVKGRPTSDTRIPRSNFMLQAVSNHYGTMDGGHYTAYCRKFSNWARFDDQEVSQINSRDVITPAAYILFYCNNSP